MRTGRIKWFSQQLGSGFIRGDEGENVFFNYSVIACNDPKTIQRGQRVIFDIAKNLQSISLTATRVTLITMPA